MDSLLKNATQVLSSTRKILPITWLTDTKLLAQEWVPIKGYNWKNPLFRSVTLELPTRATTTTGTSPHRLLGTASWDRKWVLIHNRTPWVEEVSAFSLNNHPSQHWHLVNTQPGDDFIQASEPIWIAKGRAWVMLIFRHDKKNRPQLYALHGELDHPGKVQPLPLGESNDATGGYFSYWSEIAQAHLVASPDGDLIYGLHSTGTKDGTQLWRWEFRLSQGQRSRREFKLPFPKDEGVKAVAYHAGNQRLAVLATQTYDKWSIHTMRLDGSQRVCLGTVTSRYPLEKLEWLPSGKKLSFRYDNALWVVPDAPPIQAKVI